MKRIFSSFFLCCSLYFSVNWAQNLIGSIDLAGRNKKQTVYFDNRNKKNLFSVFLQTNEQWLTQTHRSHTVTLMRNNTLTELQVKAVERRNVATFCHPNLIKFLANCFDQFFRSFCPRNYGFNGRCDKNIVSLYNLCFFFAAFSEAWPGLELLLKLLFAKVSTHVTSQTSARPILQGIFVIPPTRFSSFLNNPFIYLFIQLKMSIW